MAAYSEAHDGYFASRVATWLDETSATSGTIAGRGRGFALGTAVGGSADVEQTYAFAGTGRLDSLTTQRNANTASRVFHYDYEPDSPLVKTLWTEDNAHFVTAAPGERSSVPSDPPALRTAHPPRKKGERLGMRLNPLMIA